MSLAEEHQSVAADGSAAGKAARWLLLAVAVVVVVVDQATKAWAVANLEGEPVRPLLGDFLQLTFVRNSGAAFSFGAGQTWMFTIIAGVVIGAILWFSPRVRNRWWGLALGLLLGGALGNFIDRWVQPPEPGQGHVVDFLMLPSWPVFNVADMSVIAGAALMILLSVLGVDYGAPGADADAAADAAVEVVEGEKGSSEQGATDRG